MKHKLQCVIVDDEPIAREIIASYIAKLPYLEVVKNCKNASEAILFMQENKADIYFLDINMPEISGLSLAKIINNNAHIFFTTAHREFALEGFDLNVVDYLLKPISFDRFLLAIQKINHISNDETNNEFMFIRAERKMIKIDFDKILFIESLSDYVKIVTQEDQIITRETISNLEAKLDAKKFLRIHRSYIVSLNKINSYTNEFVEIHNKALPISRTFKESVLQKLAEV